MPKQMKLPGTEGKSIKEIDDAAEHLITVRDTRMDWTKKETDAVESLAKAMKKHKLDTYRDDDASPPLFVQLLEGKIRVKVTAVKEGEEAEAPKKSRKKKGEAEAAAGAEA